MFETEGLSKDKIVQMFLSYFYANRHDRKFDASKASLGTYLMYKYYGFLRSTQRKMISIMNREYYPSQTNPDEHGQKLMLEPKGPYQGDTQSEDWFLPPTESGVFKPVDLRPYVPDGPEKHYLKQEMLETCLGYLDENEYPSAYWKVLYGMYEPQDAANELLIDISNVYKNLNKIKLGLKKRLLAKGFTADDFLKLIE
jgi:hypothetical protein